MLYLYLSLLCLNHHISIICSSLLLLYQMPLILEIHGCQLHCPYAFKACLFWGIPYLFLVSALQVYPPLLYVHSLAIKQQTYLSIFLVYSFFRVSTARDSICYFWPSITHTNYPYLELAASTL